MLFYLSFHLHRSSLGGIASVGVMLSKADKQKELSKQRHVFQSFIEWSEGVTR